MFTARLLLTTVKFSTRTTTPTRLFTTTAISKMVAPAGLLSNRYKVDDMPDLTGKIAVVTGGSRGIGEALVSALVQKGCQVHILSATKEHGDEAISNIAQIAPKATSLITHHVIDLGSLRSVASTASTLSSSLSRLDLLFLIAGVGVGPYGLTSDQIGNHFAVNHLASMVLVDGLLGKMKETSKSKQDKGELERFSTRIVAESSELHRASPEVEFASLEELSDDNKDMDPTRLYARAKLCNILFIKELAKRHLPPLTSSTPIMALSTHPGTVSTEQQKGATEAYGMAGKLLEGAAALLFMSKEQGSESALWAGTGKTAFERKEEVQGRYFSEADGKVGTESSQAMEDGLAEKLWDLSKRILKDKIGYEVKM